MTQTSETTTPSAEELTALITEFEQYRERLIDDTMAIAKKAKKSKQEAMAQIEPELQKIDAALAQLRSQV